ncbi:hypothetical protein [Metabacillus arenae]|uniref:YneQ n=1 Tax=Metabacillus arenae TaxID=2771434 RepID=A0A926NF50_9BACI|nr:hypothetical protein [Metabacillus arenae]MBD1379348.1 hypothetical protein [Metabacillus arenae]
MAFGIKRQELMDWKNQVKSGNIAFLTHYWLDERFPDCHTVTKVGCTDIQKLIDWGYANQLRPEWIHYKSDYPHFDLLGERQIKVLKKYGLDDHILRFQL